jgi:hypothetical protein
VDPEFGLVDGVILLMSLGILFLIAVFFQQSGLNALIGRLLLGKTENTRYKLGDWYYSRTWRAQKIIKNTVYTVWYTILFSGLFIALVYFGN